jgi:hypothetical protein
MHSPNPPFQIRPMGTIPEQRRPASSVDETERPIMQHPVIRVGGGLVNHLTPKHQNIHSFYFISRSREAAAGGALSKAIA